MGCWCHSQPAQRFQFAFFPFIRRSDGCQYRWMHPLDEASNIPTRAQLRHPSAVGPVSPSFSRPFFDVDDSARDDRRLPTPVLLLLFGSARCTGQRFFRRRGGAISDTVTGDGSRGRRHGPMKRCHAVSHRCCFFAAAAAALTLAIDNSGCLFRRTDRAECRICH